MTQRKQHGEARTSMASFFILLLLAVVIASTDQSPTATPAAATTATKPFPLPQYPGQRVSQKAINPLGEEIERESHLR